MYLTSRDLSNASCTALMYDQGAQVVRWTPLGQQPALWLSERAVFAPGVAIRGGVPIVFPWFGAGRSGDLTPSHGFARITDWTLTNLERSQDRSAVSYTLDCRSQEFEHAYQMEFRVSVGTNLALSVSVENRDTKPFSFEEALHTYLQVSDATTISIEGLSGAQYDDKALGVSGLTQDAALTLTGETDRVYRSTAAISVLDPGFDRVLHVAKTNSANTVVWNPWRERAAVLSDMADGAWREMVCIEAGNIGADAITLDPGERHELGYTITLATL